MRPVLLLCALVTGCSSAMPLAVGGDKAAGTIRYEVRNASFRTRMDGGTWAAAQADAVKRCRAWGYESATAFAAECKQRVGNRCLDDVVFREYQCASDESR